MTPVKRYLLVFFALYLGGAVLGNVLLGPPGYSKAYMSNYRAEHDHYLEIVKSGAYKIWKERPHLHELDADKIGFVNQYEASPEFRAERKRQTQYRLFFSFFTTLAVTVLAVHFGHRPLMAFLDAQIAEVRAKIEHAEQARNDAASRKQAAEAQVAQLPAQRDAIGRETAALAAREQAAIEETTRLTLERIERETEDRKLEEEHAAALRLKEELVDEAIRLFITRYRATVSHEDEEAQVDRFIRDLGTRAV